MEYRKFTYDSREDWLENRRKWIGASESAAILGCGYANQNALTVYASKVAENPSSFESSEAMIVGSLIEPGLLKIFSHFSGLGARLETPHTVRTTAEYPWIVATLDALTDDDIPVELKNVDSRLFSQWEDDECPLKFQVQCQHQMLCTGAERAYLFGLIGGNKPRIREIIRNEDFISVLIAKLTEFRGFILRKELPTDFIEWGSDATSDALKRLHPNDNGESVILDSDAEKWLEILENAKDEAKDIDVEITQAKNHLTALLGDNTYGLMPSGRRVSWTTQDRKEYTVKASSSRVFRVLKK